MNLKFKFLFVLVTGGCIGITLNHTKEGKLRALQVMPSD